MTAGDVFLAVVIAVVIVLSVVGFGAAAGNLIAWLTSRETRRPAPSCGHEKEIAALRKQLAVTEGQRDALATHLRRCQDRERMREAG